MKSSRAVRHIPWQRGWLLSAGLLAISATLFAAPPKTKVSRSAAGMGRKPMLAASASDKSAPAAREFADAYGSGLPAAPDLHLSKEEQLKADALAHFARALISEDNAESEAALAGYRRALELDPSYAELAVKVAFELAKRNDPSGGIQVLKDTIKASPKEPLPLIYLSQLYSKYLKKPDLALKYAEQAVNLDPTQIAAHLCVLEIHLANGKLEKVEQSLKRAANSESKEPEFWIQLGEVNQRLYFREGAESIAPEAMERMTAVYRKAAELGKDNAIVQAKVGDFFAEAKEMKEAVSHYVRAMELAKDSNKSVEAAVREKLARALLREGEQDEAIKLLEEITKDSPLNFATFGLLGELYELKGEVNKALANYRHSLLLDASEPSNHLRIAGLQMRLKQFNEAVETAQVARAKFPDEPQALFVLAVALSQAKKHTEAMTTFAAAEAEFKQSHEELLNASFYFSYGAAAEQAGLTDRATDLMKKAIELDPSEAGQAYNYLGYMWVERGENLDEAGEMIKKALELEPDNGAYIDSLGWYLYKRGKYEDALRELNRAAKLIEPEDPVIFEHIGDVHQAMGNTAEALRNWEKSISLEKNPKVVEKIDAVKKKKEAPVPAGAI